MLLRFTVSNFLSFAEEVEFNMFPASLKTHKDHVYDLGNGIDVLKAAAIYGANGSGKSNFVKAIQFLDTFIINGLSMVDTKHNHKLDELFENKPSTFEIEIKKNKHFYIYKLSIKSDQIINESLHESFPEKNKINLIFERKFDEKESKTSIRINDKYTSNPKEKLRFEIYEEELLGIQSLLPKIRKRVLEAEHLCKWFEECLLTILTDEIIEHRELMMNNNEEFRMFVNEIIPQLHTGIEKVEVRKVGFDKFFGDDSLEKQDLINRIEETEEPTRFFNKDRNQYFVAFKDEDRYWVEMIVTYNLGRNNKYVELDLKEQSQGSQKIIELLPIIYYLQKKEQVIVIDEINTSLHPIMTKEFLKFLMSRPTKGQLIFTTHESHLLDLDIFRQDEIWFTEKNNEGATRMYPLSDFKPRYDLDIQKGYLAGRFGAIPFIGNLKDLMPTNEI